MALFDPYALVNPYAANFSWSPLPPAVKIETGPGDSAFQLYQKGIRSELSQDVIINRGEIEAQTTQGQAYQFSVPTQDSDGSSYYADVVATETTSGEGGFVPVTSQADEPGPAGDVLVYEPYAIEQTAYIPYEDLSQYFYQQPVPETAPYQDTFDSGSYYYSPPETGTPYVPPAPQDSWQPYTPEEVYAPEEQFQEVTQEEWLDYTNQYEQLEVQNFADYGYYDYGQYF